MFTLTTSMPHTCSPAPSQGYAAELRHAVPMLNAYHGLERAGRSGAGGERAPEEGSVRDCLCVRGDEIVLGVAQVHIARAERAEDVLDEVQRPVGGAVLDENLPVTVRTRL